jgi:hypothetical protein
MAEKKFYVGNRVRITFSSAVWENKLDCDVNFFNMTGEVIKVNTLISTNYGDVSTYDIRVDDLGFIKTMAGIWLELLPNPLMEWLKCQTRGQ